MSKGIARRYALGLVPVSAAILLAMSPAMASADSGYLPSKERGEQHRGDRGNHGREDTTVCNGQPDGTGNGILTGTFDNVVVPPGDICLLLHARVLGHVIADRAKQLGMDDTTVGEFVEADRVTDNGFICGSTIHQDVFVTRSASAPNSLPPTWEIGQEPFCGDPAFDPKGPGNFIGGNLIFVRNMSGGMISNNDIEKNLVCEQNSPPPVGNNNAVDGKATGQCSMFTPGADDSLSPSDGE